MFEKNSNSENNFPKIIGQKRALEILDQALENNHLPQSYLFIGTKGVGKKSVATILAKRLNCQQNSRKSAPCELCSACRRIERGSHPEVKIIKPEGEFFLIDQVLQLQSELQYKSWENGYKVYILDEAEKFTPEAANALLKTLEEPPPQVMIILIVERERKLLPTIVSRCQKIYFNPLPKNLIAEKLAALKKISLSQAQILAQASSGSLGTALRLDEENFIQEREKVLILWSKLKQLSLPEILEEGETHPGNREELKDFIQVLSIFAREKFYQEPSRQHTKILERIIAGQKQLEQNLNVRLVRDNLFLDLTELLREAI